MSERYTRLFSLSENLYAEGSPAVISAGALLKDNQTGKVLVQLKIKNIGTAVIKAAKVCIQPLDTVGAKLGGEVGYTYLDLNVHRDEEFGQKTLIPMPEKETRRFEVRLTEAIFTDNTVWKESGSVWESLPAPASINTIGDAELVKQYRIKYGTNSTICPMKVKDLWYCACGALNREGKCYRCGRNFADLNAVDMEALKAERDERRAKEKAEAEEARIAAEKAARKRKKVFAIVTPIVVACIAFLIVLTKVIIPNSRYNAAVALMDAGQYTEAISAFEAMEGYKDSAYLIIDCNYNAAIALMNEGKYTEAIDAFYALKGYKESLKHMSSCQTALKDIDYKAAVALLDEGKIVEAYESFAALNGYKDSSQKADEVFAQYEIEKMKDVKVGDIVLFGAYEQDTKRIGKERIEWLVLAKEKNKLLVISDKVLDTQKYNTSRSSVTWEECSLRKWMNGTFLNNAFSADEQAKVATSNVSADKNPKYSTNPGNSTNDKVFLLSIKEAEKYFASDSARQCSATAYAKAQGAETNARLITYGWWLRSPGLDQGYAANINSDGSVYDSYLVNSNLCVRPALWINLDS